MAELGIPHRFTISNRTSTASTITGDGCSEITFNERTLDRMWSVIRDGEGFYGFQQAETGYWATAVEGKILACPDFSEERQSSFFIVRNQDGSYLVQLNTARAVWERKTDGSLGLGEPKGNPDQVFYFRPV